MSGANDLEGKSFEDLIQMLEKTIEMLDGNDLTLEQSISTYERSVAIAEACETILNTAELRISQIDARKPLDPDADDDKDLPF